MSAVRYSLSGVQAVCYHCGENCDADGLLFDDHAFCCAGCRTVYELLEGNGMSCYYDLNARPGTSQKLGHNKAKYSWLDDQATVAKLVQYADEDVMIATFRIPSIHCSSCIYLLENIFRIQPAIVRAQVNFIQKDVRLTFRHQDISLRQVVELISSIGYEPQLSLEDLTVKSKQSSHRSYYLKIGVAFFCFGNIMLLSFPEYLGIDALSESPMRHFFGYLNFILALPVLFYSAGEFFLSAYLSLRQWKMNMDIPIVLGMMVMFARSSYDIFMQQGAGYMDTLASLTLLMLIGRLFQNKTYATLSFDRDYKSYFPISVNLIRNDKETSIPLSNLHVGDRLVIRNEELIPADAILISGDAMIDYSFVTGESAPVSKKSGDMIYAGGKQTGSSIELDVIKEVSHSYLTQLWNDDAFKSKEIQTAITLATEISRWFTPIVIFIAIAAGSYWIHTDMHKAVNAFTAVLIITCPCALALSAPFTMGNVLRILARRGIYLKNTVVVEKLASVSTIIFDKTGTLTDKSGQHIQYKGEELSDEVKTYIASLTYHTLHPLGRKIYHGLTGYTLMPVSDFRELHGQGIEGYVNGDFIKMGSATYVNALGDSEAKIRISEVHISIDGQYKGRYEIRNEYRRGLQALVSRLKTKFDLYVLSGDNDSEKENLKKLIPSDHLLFDQQPADKLQFIKEVQSIKKGTVLMVGDGLNDAGALRQSDVGLVISDDTNNFSPACDGIIDAREFSHINSLVEYASAAMRIVKLSYAISLLYNLAGLYLAVRGTMSPIMAAILMPVSSVTIITFSTLSSWLAARKHGFA